MTFINSFYKQAKNAVLVSSMILFSTSSFAGVTSVADGYEVFVTLTGNDCGGRGSSLEPILGKGTNCTITIDGNEIAVVLTKLEYNDGTASAHDDGDDNDPYEYSVDHWTISEGAITDDYETGTWTAHTGIGYPEVSFWSAKSSTSSNLYWKVSDLDQCSTILSFECMNSAVVATTGSWTTPTGQALSHLTFFGGICLQDCEPDNNTEVPEPSTIAIFALALSLLRIQSKRRNT